MDQAIKRLLWLYFLLLVGEGVLRKWIAPGLSEPLLIIRDPVVFAIYGLAFMRGEFPARLSMLVLAFLAVASFVFAVVAGSPLLVALYGLRINYLHVPLIFIMGTTLTREDVLRYGRVVLWLTPPIAALMVLQYQAGSGSRLNVGAGGELDGQLRGALDKMRPSGPFSFITGPILWFSLASAFIFHGWTSNGTHPRWLLGIATLMLVVAVPVSISRSLLFSVLVVVLFGLTAILRAPKQAFAVLVPAGLVLGTLMMLNGSELSSAFGARWQSSIGTGVEESIFKRFLGDFESGLSLISSAPLFGHGVGMGSNVGTRYVSGSMGFALAESEWAKIILELGPLLGLAFIAYRGWLAFTLLSSAARHLLQNTDGLPWLLAAACLLPVISGQWAPPTILGFAVFGGGLVLAALKTPGDTDNVPEDDAHPADEIVTEKPIPRNHVRRV